MMAGIWAGLAVGMGISSMALGQPVTAVERVVLTGDVIDGVTVESIERLQLNNHGDIAFQARVFGPIVRVRGGQRAVVVDLTPDGFQSLLMGQFSPAETNFRSLTDSGEIVFFGIPISVKHGVYVAGVRGVRKIVERTETDPWFGTSLEIVTASGMAASSGGGMASWGSFQDSEVIGDSVLYGFLFVDDGAGNVRARPHSFWIQKPDISVGPSSVLDMNGSGNLLLSGSTVDTGGDLLLSNIITDSLILSVDGVNIVVAYGRQPFPGQGFSLSDLPGAWGYVRGAIGEAVLSEQSSVLFRASLTDSNRVVTEALFLWSGGLLRRVIREGDSVFNLKVGKKPVGRFDRDGRVYWLVREEGNMAMPRTLLWAGNGLGIDPFHIQNKLLVSNFLSTPEDIGGGTFFGADDFAFAEDLGRLIYEGRYSDADGTPRVGIWSKKTNPRSDNPSRLRLRDGQRIQIAENDWRTVDGIRLIGSTRDGLVTTKVAFQDGSEGVFQFHLKRGKADLNIDGVLDINDIHIFTEAFLKGDAVADWNNDGIVNAVDSDLFAASFLKGVGG